MSCPASIQDPAIYKAILESAAEAIICVDRAGAIRIWNHGAEALFGYSADEMLGRALDAIIPERLRAGHAAGFSRAVETGATRYGGRVMTTRSVHKSGRKLYVDLSFGLVRDATGAVSGAFAVGRDCTERHEAQKKSAPKST